MSAVSLESEKEHKNVVIVFNLPSLIKFIDGDFVIPFNVCGGRVFIYNTTMADGVFFLLEIHILKEKYFLLIK